MKSLTTYLTIAFFISAFSLKFHWNAATPDFDLSKNSSLMVCPNSCQTVDSLALIAIYNSTTGPAWTTTWNTALPVCTPWPGIELDDDGYVIRITLNSNNLTGPLPSEIGNFSRLEELQLDNNNLSGNLLPEIGNLSELNICFLDDNFFVGTIPDEFGNLSHMHTLYLDNNELTGTIPNTFLNLNNLFKFDIFNNQIDSIPNFTAMNLQPNKFRIYNNNVTFDDIVFNQLSDFGTNYTPQDSVNQPYTVNLQTGTDYTLDLGFDNGVTDSEYQWYRNGVPFGTPTNSNNLIFSPVTWTTAGEYRCQVINPNAPLLTLHTRPVTINVSCGTSVFLLDDTVCPDYEIIINTVIYNQSNPSGTQPVLIPDQYGCDSMIVIDLDFRPENITPISPILCAGEDTLINGVIFNQASPTGMVTLTMPDQFGCDSILDVSLTFRPENITTLDSLLCPRDSVVINGVIYNQNNPTGTEVLSTPDQFGCDSIVNINLTFRPDNVTVLNPLICSGDSVTINGTVFNQSNPSGIEILSGQDQNGCDSILNISVSFRPENITAFTPTICLGDSLIINGTIYNQTNPTGTETLATPDQHGCDSIIDVALNFYNAAAAGTLSPIICPGDSVELFGVFYSQSNPTATITLAGASETGCDSTLTIEVSFYPPATGNYNPTTCEGGSLEYGGLIFTESSPSGTVNLGQISQYGCDSIVDVNVTFFGPLEGLFETTLCPNDSVIINGTVYNQSNPTGTEFYPNGGQNNCDSIVFINLTFNSSIIETIDQTLCREDSILVNGIPYNFNNPNGNEMIAGGSVSGCDSTVIIDLSFYPVYESNFETTICQGDSILINGTVYNEANPNGVELFENGSLTNCDSTVHVNLSFFPPNISNINQTLCLGDSIIVNGVTYNEANPSGTEIFAGGSSSGCDSIVEIDLDFLNEIVVNFGPKICIEDSVIINGNTYNFNTPSGTETLPSSAGCDSTININLSFYPNDPGFITQTLCSEQGIFINGTAYNENNPSGTEVLENFSINGCDSTIIINLTFIQASENLVNPTLCPGDSLLINNVVYNENNLTGVQYLENEAASGCDSIITIDLSYYIAVTAEYAATICPEDSVVINGVAYNVANPTGTEVLENANINGCDSTVNISLDFYSNPQIFITDTLCDEEELIINNQSYNFSNQSGIEIIENGSVNGCDSIINIQLTFNVSSVSEIIDTLCSGDSIQVNGVTYNEANAIGTEVFPLAAANGCDSIVSINLSFFPIPTGIVDPQICVTDSVVINGVTYNFSNPTGTEFFENSSTNGCDSIVNINLSFFTTPTGVVDPQICVTDSVVVNGVTYNFLNPTGTELFENASTNGCDSIVDIQLSFFDSIETNVNLTLCEGETYELDGILYDANTPNGTAVFEGEGINGCDSIVHLQLNFYDSIIDTLSLTICQEETIVVNGTTYDILNESGTEVFENVGINGCDSTVFVDLQFFAPAVLDTTASICIGSSFEIEGNSYNESGFYTISLEGQSSNGCDSLIHLNLTIMEAVDLGLANAGDDISQCANFLSLNANQPNQTTGLWSTTSGIVITNPTEANIDLENLSSGYHTFIWTLSTAQCVDYDSDSLEVYIQSAPNAVDDHYTLDIETSTLEIDLLENDNFSSNDGWTFALLSEPTQGTLLEMNEGLYEFQRTSPIGGALSFDYQICDEDCPELCDTATVSINLVLQSIDDLDIPNAITPNDDGVNETFMFPHLEFEADRYPDNELIIFNRWGDIIYEAKPYLNDWRGVDQSGNPLPQGTYYYVLRLNIADGVILKGDVSILK